MKRNVLLTSEIDLFDGISDVYSPLGAVSRWKRKHSVFYFEKNGNFVNRFFLLNDVFTSILGDKNIHIHICARTYTHTHTNISIENTHQTKGRMSSGRSKLYLNNLTNKVNSTQEWMGQRIFVGKFFLQKKYIVIHRVYDVTFNTKRYGSRRKNMYNMH